MSRKRRTIREDNEFREHAEILVVGDWQLYREEDERISGIVNEWMEWRNEEWLKKRMWLRWREWWKEV